MFSENIKKLKAKWGMTHDDLAAILNDPKINKDTISNLSRNNTTPSPAILVQLEVLTGIPVYDLFMTVIDFDAIPPAPLKPERIDRTHEADQPTYKPQEWPTMGIREFFNRNEKIFDEMKKLSKRVDALEGKGDKE